MERGFCPKCGNELVLPDGLEEFSCLYCGERLDLSRLLRQAAATNPEEDYLSFQRDALHAAVDFPQSMEQMSRPLFFDYFDRYYADCSAPFEALERCAIARGADWEAVLARAAAWLMEQIDAWFRAQKGWSFPPRRSELRDRTKFTIAIFLVPTACRSAPAIGKAFGKKLREQWLLRYPDSPFELTTYEELAAGFRKLPSCFITTAVCEFLGQPDDCAMLTDFRAFRDGYLRAQPGGQNEIREYYDRAPGVVARIDCCEDRAVVYPRLYQDYLLPCHEALREGNPARCRAIYRRMMNMLLKN